MINQWASDIQKLLGMACGAGIAIGKSIADKVGKEVVVRYSTIIASNRTFYTDSNGRQILTRLWVYRPSWKYTMFEPISVNYYPVNSRIFVRDQSRDVQMTVLNDRSQGGTSPEDGQIELGAGDSVIHFGNAESAMVLAERLQYVIALLQSAEVRHD